VAMGEKTASQRRFIENERKTKFLMVAKHNLSLAYLKKHINFFHKWNLSTTLNHIACVYRKERKFQG
jgi:hypothetical protein